MPKQRERIFEDKEKRRDRKGMKGNGGEIREGDRVGGKEEGRDEKREGRGKEVL